MTDTIRVRLLVVLHRPGSAVGFRAGSEIDLPTDEAEALIAAGAAEPIAPPAEPTPA